MANEIKKYLDSAALSALVSQIKAADAAVAQEASLGLQGLANGQVKTNKDNIATLMGNAETAGSVAKALADAKEYADTQVDGLAKGQVKTNKEAIGTLESLDTTAKSDLVTAINEVRNAVSAGGTAAAITMDTSTTTEGALKSYTIKQGDNTVGTIDIPKDMVVESGEVVVNPEGQAEGTYIKLKLANVEEPLYINVGTLVDIYKAKEGATHVQIDIDSSTREISAEIVDASIGTGKLADGAVTTVKIADNNVTKAKLSTELQTAIDQIGLNKSKLDEIQDSADANVIEVVKVNGVALTPDANKAVDVSVPTGALASKDAVAESDLDSALATKLNGMIDAGELESAFTTERTEIDKELAKKVDKVDGKGLSTNDLTAVLKGQYDAAYEHSTAAHAPVNAQANIIETIKVNGTALTPDTAKAVDIAVPTDNADLANGAGYITADAIKNKADKATTLSGYGITDAYTSAQIDERFAEYQPITAAEVNNLFAPAQS